MDLVSPTRRVTPENFSADDIGPANFPSGIEMGDDALDHGARILRMLFVKVNRSQDGSRCLLHQRSEMGRDVHCICTDVTRSQVARASHWLQRSARYPARRTSGICKP